MNWNEQIAIVTGASRGIGREIAIALSRQGAQVACVATTLAGSQGTADECGGKAYACDVSRSEEVEALVAKVVEEMGAPAILVNNAGITRDTLMLRMKDEDWDRVIDVNLKGCFNTIRAVAKPMMKLRYGRIVNITSIVGIGGAAGQANYAAAKAGMIGLTKSAAKELGSRSITCNAVAPGFIVTDMTEGLPEEFRAQVEKSAPAGRLGTAQDVAAAVTFLASPEASYITGQVLVVDGGLSL